MGNIVKQLSGSNFRLYNVDIARLTSVNASIVLGWLSVLVDKHKNNEIFTPYRNIVEYTGLTENEIRTSINKLKSVGFVKVEKKGIPAKNYYTLQVVEISSYLNSIEQVIEKVDDKDSENDSTGVEENNPLLKNSNIKTKKRSKKNNNDFSKNFTNDEYKEIFDIARKNYPGSKRGLEVEYNNFVKKEKEWKKYIFELNNSIEKYKEYIKAKNMQNYIKNFTTWINQADYTMEYAEVEKKDSDYDLFLSKFKDYELNLSKELDNLIRHFLKKRFSEEQMDKTANEIHYHFMNMHTSHFDMALRECIDNNSVKIFFEDYSHLRDYELDTLKNDFIMKGVYA